ncbi:phosphotransferase [Jonesiaceae bacterium BS-20]|uniref:Phosphotransferase n=1 Tax=Jonesiaceae bacterium BS-20 TaxID=3120821 RepID=A0AAU7DVW1_9MICO
MAMHHDQLHINEELTRQLIAEQFSQWQAKPITHVVTDGTENAIFRIGDGLAARFPLRAMDPIVAMEQQAQEHAAMRNLASYSPVPTPEIVGIGYPSAGFPLPWSVQTWIPGTVTTPSGLMDSVVLPRISHTSLPHFAPPILRVATSRARAAVAT